MVVSEFTKITPKEHPSFEKLESAHEKITEVVALINEKKKLEEDLQKVVDIQESIEGKMVLSLGEGLWMFTISQGLELIEPSRRFVREGQLLKRSKRRFQERHYFLFSDLIVYVKMQQYNPFKKHAYQFKGAAEFPKIELTSIADSPSRGKCLNHPLTQVSRAQKLSGNHSRGQKQKEIFVCNGVCRGKI